MWQNGVILLNYRGGFTVSLQSPQTIRELMSCLLFRFSFKLDTVMVRKSFLIIEEKPSRQHPTFLPLCQAGARGPVRHRAL